MAARKKATETKKTAEVKTAEEIKAPANEENVPVETKEEITEKPVEEAEEVKAPAKAQKAAEEKKPAAKKTTTRKTTVKKTAAKKETEGKEAKAEEKPVAETKTKKPAAKKTEVKASINLQFAGKSYNTEDLIKSVKDIWKYDLKKKAGDFKTVDLYVKPEENAVYYVVNGEVTGSFHI